MDERTRARAEFDERERREREPRGPLFLIDNLRGLIDDALELVRAEINLAKAELSEKFAQAQLGLGMLFLGMTFFAVAAFLLAQALVAWIAVYLGEAGAALLVGGIVLILGVIALLIAASNLKPSNLKPERTLRSTSENTRRLKETFHDQIK